MVTPSASREFGPSNRNDGITNDEKLSEAHTIMLPMVVNEWINDKGSRLPESFAGCGIDQHPCSSRCEGGFESFGGQGSRRHRVSQEGRCLNPERG